MSDLKAEYGEPWSLGFKGGRHVWSGDELVSAFSDGDRAERIIACINFCAGIPTDQLEKAGFGGLKRMLSAASRCEPIMNECEGCAELTGIIAPFEETK